MLPPGSLRLWLHQRLLQRLRLPLLLQWLLLLLLILQMLPLWLL